MKNERWYGLVVNGELRSVRRFSHRPTIFDFDDLWYSSENEYEVVEVNVEF